MENFFRSATLWREFTAPMSCVGNTVGGSYIVHKSLVVKRSVVLAGHKTSVSLEDAFWNSLREIARSQGMTLSSLLTTIDSDRHQGNLSSAIRLFVLQSFRDQLSKAIGGEGPGDATTQAAGGFNQTVREPN
jgi:predicted DNA-binding ribbon-helix-helix protein